MARCPGALRRESEGGLGAVVVSFVEPEFFRWCRSPLRFALPHAVRVMYYKAAFEKAFFVASDAALVEGRERVDDKRLAAFIGYLCFLPYCGRISGISDISDISGKYRYFRAMARYLEHRTAFALPDRCGLVRMSRMVRVIRFSVYVYVVEWSVFRKHCSLPFMLIIINAFSGTLPFDFSFWVSFFQVAAAALINVAAPRSLRIHIIFVMDNFRAAMI